MAIVMQQSDVPEQGSTKSEEVMYNITGAATLNDALVKLLTDAPQSRNGKYLSSVDSSVTERDAGSGNWRGTARYNVPELTSSQQQDTFTVSFDISGTTQKITQSRGTTPYKNFAGADRDFGGAIGVSSDGTVEGCDIIVPNINYEFQNIYPETQFDDGTFIRTLISLVGKVNSDVFRGLEIGEALLSKVSGQRRADRKWVVKFAIAVSENETDLKIPDDAPGTSPDPSAPYAFYGINKRGWDYLWVYYRAQKMGPANAEYTSRIPVNAYVEQVYKFVSYAPIDEGTEA